MAALPVYAEWWRMTESCSALSGDFSRYQWYVVPDVASIEVEGRPASGAWLGDRIVIAGAYVRDGRVVRHEMLHALRGKPGHPRTDFVAHCGTVVNCGPDCWMDPAAAPRVLGATVVDPSALDVSVASWPESPARQLFDGYVGLVLTMRNPRSERVVVRLPAGASPLFRYRYVRDGVTSEGGSSIFAPELVTFAPGETKRMIFDFWIDAAGPLEPMLPPGAYAIEAAYAGRWTPPLSMLIAP